MDFLDASERTPSVILGDGEQTRVRRGRSDVVHGNQFLAASLTRLAVLR
jgi:hypothetical protein